MLWLVLNTSARESLLDDLFAPVLVGAGVDSKFVSSLGDVKASDGDVALIFGAELLKPLREGGFLHKSLTVASLRGTVFDLLGCKCLVTFDPFEVNTISGRSANIQWDVRLAMRLHQTGGLEPTDIGKYQYVENFNEVVDFVSAEILEGRKPLMSYDLETISIDPYAPEAYIVSVAITIRDEESFCYVTDDGVLAEYVRVQLKYLLSEKSIKTTGANIKFDANWTALHFGIEIKNVTFDVGIVASLLDENRENNLNLLAKVYTTMGGYDDKFNDAHDKSRMDVALRKDPEGFLTYAGGDTDAAFRVYKPLKESLLNDHKLATFYHQLMNKAIHTFSKMEQRGVLVDLDRYQQLKVEVEAEIVRLNAELIDMIPTRVKIAHDGNLKLSRDSVLVDLFFSPKGFDLKPLMWTPTKKISVAIDHLKMFDMHPVAGPFVKLLKEYNSAMKTMSTYITGFMKHVRSDDRWHPSYNLYNSGFGGTVTGRLSATDPAYQTIPMHTSWAKPIRSVIIPPEGMAILKLDYSQGELRVMACVAEEPTMLNAYAKGLDLHSITAAEVNHMSLEKFMALPDGIRDELRFGAKAVNFGQIYGMMPPGFVVHARDVFGINYTLEEAIKIRTDFFGLYDRLLPYHGGAIDYAKKNGYVRSPLGRIRHLPLIRSPVYAIASKQERQAINSPIQSTLSDMMIFALNELNERYPDLWAFGTTHDESQFYVPVDEVFEWKARIQDVMENLPFEKLGWEPQIKFTVDAAWSPLNLADCVKIK